jgi:hypothetical protein
MYFTPNLISGNVVFLTGTCFIVQFFLKDPVYLHEVTTHFYQESRYVERRVSVWHQIIHANTARLYLLKYAAKYVYISNTYCITAAQNFAVIVQRRYSHSHTTSSHDAILVLFITGTSWIIR